MIVRFHTVELVEQLIENMNQGMITANIPRVYSIDIRDRERKVTYTPPIPEVYIYSDKIGKPVTKTQYYGTLLFYVDTLDETTREVKDRLLLFRQEYVFFNLTAKTKDFLWKEKICKVFLYESLGTFAATCQAIYQDDKDKNAKGVGSYDIIKDCYLNKEGQEIESVPTT